MAKPTKRCPFCGGEGILQRIIFRPRAEFFIYCRNCGIETPVFKTQEEAVTYWNTRAS